MKTKLTCTTLILLSCCLPVQFQDTLPILALAVAASSRTDYRSMGEHNDIFESAVCKYDPFELHLFPSTDIDFYKFSIQNTSLKLYILYKASFGSDNNLNFQIYKNTNDVIYDVNNVAFDTVSVDIKTNRNMSQADCGVFTSNCVGLENLRYIEFQGSVKDFVLKFSTKDQSRYEENKNQPRKINLLPNVSQNVLFKEKSILAAQDFLVFFDGDFKKCSE